MNKRLRRMVDRTLVYYVIIGVLNFILCTAIMFLLFNVCGFSDHIAPLFNYVLGSLIWYLACRYILFPAKQSSWKQIVRFVAEVLVVYVVSYYVIAPLLSRVLLPNPKVRAFFSFGGEEADMVKGNCEMTIGAAAYAILNYFGQRYYVFSKRYEIRELAEQSAIEILSAEEGLPKEALSGTDAPINAPSEENRPQKEA